MYLFILRKEVFLRTTLQCLNLLSCPRAPELAKSVVSLQSALYFYIIDLLEIRSVQAKEETIGEIGRMKMQYIKISDFVGGN